MQTLAEQHTHSQEIKKSRFIAVALPVSSREKALEKIEEIRDPQATHNCWAYKVGDEYRFSDDGEPGGTAGRPILAAIEGQGLDRVLVVVTRFFGGIKLGAGGLVRAYGGSAAECLRTASKKEVTIKVIVNVEAPFGLTGAVYPLLDQFQAQKLDEIYVETGLVLKLKIDEHTLSTFKTALADATRGKAAIRRCR